MNATPGGTPPGPQLSLQVSSDGSWLTVHLRGELDVATAAMLIDRISLLITQKVAPQIALDLSQVPFCDSSGLNALIRLWKRAHAAGGRLVLLRPQPRLAATLTQTAIDRHIPVHDTPPS